MSAQDDREGRSRIGPLYAFAALVAVSVTGLVIASWPGDDSLGSSQTPTPDGNAKRHTASAGTFGHVANHSTGSSSFASREGLSDIIVPTRENSVTDYADSRGSDDANGGSVDGMWTDADVVDDASSYESIRDDMEVFLDGFVRTLCALKNRCCGPGTCSLDGWSTTFAASMAASRIDLFRKDKVFFNDQGAKACLSRVASLECSWDFDVFPADCRLVIRGTVEDHQPCLYDENCAGEESVCVKESVYSSFGLCAPLLKPGDLCDYDSECQEGSCEPVSRVCVAAPPKPGTVCTLSIPH